MWYEILIFLASGSGVYFVSGTIKKEYKQGLANPVKIEDENCLETLFPKCFPALNRLVFAQAKKNYNKNFLYKDLNKKWFSTTANRNSENQATTKENFVILNPWFLTGFIDE